MSGIERPLMPPYAPVIRTFAHIDPTTLIDSPQVLSEPYTRSLSPIWYVSVISFVSTAKKGIGSAPVSGFSKTASVSMQFPYVYLLIISLFSFSLFYAYSYLITVFSCCQTEVIFFTKLYI